VPLAVLATASSIAASIAMIIALPAFFQAKDNTTAAVRIVENPSIQINTINTDSQPIKINSAISPVQKHNEIANNIPSQAEKVESRYEEHMSLHIPEPQLTHARKNVDVSLVFNTFNASAWPQKIQPSSLYKKYNAARNLNLDFGSEEKVNKTSLGIASGVNYGASISGYSIGATGKRMLGNKFYLEGDIAFVTNTTTEKNSFTTVYKNGGISARKTALFRTSGGGDDNSGSGQRITEVNYAYSYTSTDIRENNYNLYYAQLTPSFGCIIHKEFSVGFGGDFQRLLIDGRPVTVADNTGASKEIPAFDIGLVGKTECALSKKIKAGICYRQGFNNIINGNNRYMDRTYVQVQMKYLIFKK
jgi:hypothetical protein